jgi:hypothetical protein
MAGKISSLDEIARALPRMQEAVRKEIQARVDVGETIAGHGEKVEVTETAKRDKSAA